MLTEENFLCPLATTPPLGSQIAARPSIIPSTVTLKFEEVHVDIGFGDTVAVGGACYCLVFVDRATRYNCVFVLKTLFATNIRDAFNFFRAQAGRFATCFHADCDDQLLGWTIKSYLTENDSDTVCTAAGRQSSSGLVESHWKILVHMSHAYLTEKADAT